MKRPLQNFESEIRVGKQQQGSHRNLRTSTNSDELKPTSDQTFFWMFENLFEEERSVGSYFGETAWIAIGYDVLSLFILLHVGSWTNSAMWPHDFWRDGLLWPFFPRVSTLWGLWSIEIDGEKKEPVMGGESLAVDKGRDERGKVAGVFSLLGSFHGCFLKNKVNR